MRTRPALAMLAALALAGCVAAIRAARAPGGFDHAAHGKRDVGCADCHTPADAGKYGMPALSVCADCHDPKEDKPQVAAAVRDYGATLAKKDAWPSAAVRGPTYGDLRFDHAKHEAKKVDCTACHTGVATGAEPNPSGPLPMQACMDCHAERGAKQDCASCHDKLGKEGKEGKPPNHEPGWTLHHGIVSRMADPARSAERCDLCHARADCDRCHTRNAPRDHNNPFRVASHGLSAAMDRSRCLACHTQDSCTRCHETQPPRSHRASWGNPRDTHCLSCHDSAGGGLEGCATCHKGTPSHALAPPKPAVPVHSAAMNCRQCHGVGVKMPHVDNGSDCNTCHK